MSEVNLRSRIEEIGKVGSDEETCVGLGFEGPVVSGVEK